MSCVEIELLLAGDNLTDREARRVEEHCALCETCREFRKALVRARAALASLKQDVPKEAAFVELRRRIRQKITTPRAGVGALSWRFALALCLVFVPLALALVFFLGGRTVETPRTAVSQPPAPVVAQTPAAERTVRAQRAPRVSKKRARAAAEDLVVKFVTDDPNIVIIWLVDRNGGSP